LHVGKLKRGPCPNFASVAYPIVAVMKFQV
jgi:hypothetical protein